MYMYLNSHYKVTATKYLSIYSYSQCFDLEGESGIVVRGIGTSVTLRHILQSVPSSSTYLDHSENSMNFNNLTEK